MVGIDYSDSGLRERLARVGAALRRPLMALLGKTLEVETRKHFRERGKEPHSKGWPPKHFWEREGARNTALTEVTADSATVSIASAPIAHKITGGTITPKRGRALAIPLCAEAYAAGSPREWDKPDRLFRPKGKGFLAIETNNGIKAMYALVAKVDQAPDPRALPDQAEVGAVLAAKTEDHLQKAVA